jgi:hypothetical protein
LSKRRVQKEDLWQLGRAKLQRMTVISPRGPLPWSPIPSPFVFFLLLGQGLAMCGGAQLEPRYGGINPNPRHGSSCSSSQAGDSVCYSTEAKLLAQAVGNTWQRRSLFLARPRWRSIPVRGNRWFLSDVQRSGNKDEQLANQVTPSRCGAEAKIQEGTESKD